MSAAVGVDGCKLGWFYYRRDKTSISYDTATSLEKLVTSLPSNSRIFIDIPIGLNDGGALERDCDKLARKSLGSPRASSVFPAPAFTVLAARSFEDAKRISVNSIGRMLSRQAYAITPKIREVNYHLAKNPNNNIYIREIHPELCFWGLNGRQAMKFSKKKSAGFEERMQVLGRFLPNIEEIVSGPLLSYRRSEVAKDDILDSLVALVVASTSDDQLRTIPTNPQVDSRGIPMEMVYTEHPNINWLK